ncbi:hypothetical protein [uncultured Sphingomonas sp.]|uniref:hypothetical protein n=1 Tax=uncultured Sphingomonas sp. TaxID=158754 RepID=UPI0035CC5F24
MSGLRKFAIAFGFVTMLAVSLPAKNVLTPGPKPTTVDPGRVPFAFATPPVIRPTFARDEPFLEGDLAYGYTGRVVTPIQRGGDVVAPAGSPAYGVPMRVRDRDNTAQTPDQPIFRGEKWASEAGPAELVWCAATRKPGSPRVGTVCLFDEGLTFGGNDALMTTASYILDRDRYGGGEIGPGTFDLGAPVRVRYFVQSLGKIARIKAQIWVGDVMANQWGYVFGDIGRGSQPAERLFAVGGGVIGISADPVAKDRYTLRIIEPLTPGGGAPLTEKRNDSRAR